MSSDASACAAACSIGEIRVGLNCQKCMGINSIVSVDGSVCVSECGVGERVNANKKSCEKCEEP